jgi:hypothetical protein
MLSAARLILGASLFRAESRLSHFREDFPHRDDASWLVWVDATKSGADQRFAKTAVPTPLCPVTTAVRRPSRLQSCAPARVDAAAG